MNLTWNIKSNENMSEIRAKAEDQFPVMTDKEALKKAADFFKAIADETRMKIITLLYIEDLCMCEIVAALGGASSTISHHLRIMEKGNIIQSRREGKFTIYSVNKDKLTPLLPSLLNGSSFLVG
ncbi:winged helix-turn-helix transcriptional regulator [Bacillus sp. EB106-08-02-XG196]|uniref:ArsR/SmtB family transcription factor n=1 Tax=Bacillus sp. EB106-08-02-XG196 TaxID=2737049 RepID=UPI0015C49C46|nr:metalloregulator ArsR/SmtB family transcription factor [Bacillus sp. EB106-08-02-XG196]NWQ42310.1 winged helix-turn-helix transcriptional regulator [Bacillus sp. EB106-08-02-XG196]